MSGVNSDPSLLPYVSHSVLCWHVAGPQLVFLSVLCVGPQVKRVVVYLGRDKTMQLLEELMSELELTDPVSSAVTHMDNPPYYRITSSYKIPSVTSGNESTSSLKWPRFLTK